jgi:hypothetical protein
MKPTLQESLWCPIGVLVIGIVLALSLLLTAERASTAEIAAYPPPSPICVFLPLVERGGAAVSAQARPADYPPPSACTVPTTQELYLPVIRR